MARTGIQNAVRFRQVELGQKSHPVSVEGDSGEARYNERANFVFEMSSNQAS
jgi:hypothetical protein